MHQIAPRTLFLFRESNPVRRAAVWLVDWRWFDRAILLAIIVNTVVLAMQDYKAVDTDGNFLISESWRNSLVEKSEPLFTAIFCAEMLVKCVAMGAFLPKGSYLRDPWNWIDFVVVVTSIVSSVPSVPRVGALRTFRVLRPLRALNIVPGMRIMVETLLRSIPELMSVATLLAAFFWIAALVGITLWGGALSYRCRATPWPIVMPPDNTFPLTAAGMVCVNSDAQS